MRLIPKLIGVSLMLCAACTPSNQAPTTDTTDAGQDTASDTALDAADTNDARAEDTPPDARIDATPDAPDPSDAPDTDAPPRCGDRQPGDIWDDGCLTCTCDATGQEACAPNDCAATCAELEAAYDAAVFASQACATVADCRALVGRSDVGLGGCYEAVNASLTQADLDAIAEDYRRAQCFDPAAVGDCSVFPDPTFDCLDGVCTLL